MKKLVIVIPLLGVSAFAAYYHHWNSTRQEVISCKLPLVGDVYEEYRHRDARRDAEDDLVRGQPRLLTCGLPVRWINEYGEILARDYGVTLDAVAGCIVSDSLVDYIDAYNETIERYLASVHGPYFLEKAAAKAQVLFAERRAAPNEPNGP